MKTIVLGAGHAGTTVARALADEGNDVTVIDVNIDRLRELQDQVDIATVMGQGTFPDSLQRADAENADLVIAVMPRDEDNLLACQIAWSLFHPPIIIARIRGRQYLNYPELFNKDSIPIDALISPEVLVKEHARNMIKYPGVRQLHAFTDGAIKLVALDVHKEADAVGKYVHELAGNEYSLFWLLLFRQNKLTQLTEETVIQVGDRIIYLAPRDHVLESINLFQVNQKRGKRIILAGGGHVGSRLAEALEKEFKVKVIEKNTARAEEIAVRLERAIVLHGDVANQDLLINEGIAETDVFCAVTDSDEVNILSSMLAKKLGVRQTICLVNETTYMNMIPGNVIDTVFSPGRITSASILQYVREGVVNVCAIHNTRLEVLEIVVEGKEETSGVIGLTTGQLSLPEDVILGAVTRDGYALDLNQEIVLETRDHVILVVPAKSVSSVVNYFRAKD